MPAHARPAPLRLRACAVGVRRPHSAGTFSAPGSLSQGQSVTTACHQQSMWGYVTGSMCSVPLVLCSAPVEEGAAQGASA